MLQGKQMLDENMGTFLVGPVGIKCTFSSMISTENLITTANLAAFKSKIGS